MYRRLLSNTVLFSVSTFGSKILLFLLTPFYTSILTDAEYGVTDLIIQTGNVLIPLVSMGIINAVLRFGLDETTDLKGLFTTGLVVILVGEGVLALCYPLLQSIGLLSDYVLLLLLYVLMANLHAVFGAMAQAMGKVRLYAVSGILCTALVVALNILLLSVFRLGIVGYVLSNVIADGVVALVLFGALGLWRYFQPAAVATLLSYLVILIARAVHSRSLLRVAWKVPRFVLAMGILLLQCVLVEWENTALALVCCLGILALYFRPLWRAWKTGIFTRR